MTKKSAYLLIISWFIFLASAELTTFRYLLSDEITRLVPWYLMPAFYFYYAVEVLVLMLLFILSYKRPALTFVFISCSVTWLILTISQAWAYYLSGKFIGIEALISIYAAKNVTPFWLIAAYIIATLILIITHYLLIRDLCMISQSSPAVHEESFLKMDAMNFH